MPGTSPAVSVVVCVYSDERWNDILLAIDSLKKQSAKPLQIVVVVDHNPPLLERLETRFPDLTVIPNSGHRGLSAARNSGVTASVGQLIAFLDDDARAESDWLANLRPWFEYGDVIGVGGFTEPLWETERPTWFPPSFDWTVGCSYQGLPTEAAEVRNPFGGNMVVRREVFESAGGFRTGIGRIGKTPLGGEETEFAIRARRTLPGSRFMYEPAARIHHKVPASRGKLGYFVRRCYAEGLSKAVIARLEGNRASLSSEGSYAVRVLPHQFFRHIVSAFTGDDRTGLARSVAIIIGLATTSFGYLVGLSQQHRVVIPR